MKELEHTKGPWKWGIQDHSMATLSGKDEDHDHVMSVSPCHSCYKDKTEWKWGRCMTPKEADAVLIAAAPEMLGALIESLKEFKRLHRESTNLKDKIFLDAVLAVLSSRFENAIEKATGLKIENIITGE